MKLGHDCMISAEFAANHKIYFFRCICRAIPEENVGHKLLAKMGWKEGDCLGKTNAGILEPVSVSVQYCDCCYSWSFDWCFPMLIVPLLVCRSAFGSCVFAGS